MSDRKKLTLAVDWGMGWPLNDYSLTESRPDWQELLTPELYQRLISWQRFFDQNAILESASFGSEEKRKWFDLEGVKLLNDLNDEVGHLFEFRLELWF